MTFLDDDFKGRIAAYRAELDAMGQEGRQDFVDVARRGEDWPEPRGQYLALHASKWGRGLRAAAYAQRWEIESVFDELKSHQRGPRAVLRSKSPQLVQQEMWGHLCCHYAIRTLMLDAATHAGHDPDRISFVAALRITRRSLSHSSFSPSQP